MFKFYSVKNLKPHPQSIKARLPDVYKKYVEALKQEPSPVHYIPEPNKWILDPVTKQKTRVENRAIPLKFPKEADEGIWGGEGVIQGFTKNKPKRRRFPNYWVPNLKKAVVYSEILNEYMHLTVTERTLRLIDQYHGFDNYILSVPVCDLKSQLAITLRRKMLLALVNKEKYHEDEATNQEIFDRYQKFVIPREEAEWFGLTEREAIQKQRILEEERPVEPLKHKLRMMLIEEFKSTKESGAEIEEHEEFEEKPGYFSWIKKLNPFMKN
ncbi:39S ribosomal protein L28, mitochondrial-like [Uloborus diversus]|uniref:39S ribosomal protein L28, mitochondrial-like n=1 Tax=Uloborus diversus TaxID=327109 RepID=UPI0024094879|nr:39S ribosomal protein L28, mitochondrial-like [Uloborus diversus]